MAQYVETIPEVAALLVNADHVDVKTVEGDVSLREFLASMFSYQPGWITFLYGVRAVFVRFLGMKQAGIPHPKPLAPEDISFAPDGSIYLFKVRAAKEEAYHVSGIADKHLTAELGVIVEPLSGNHKRFHVLTIVHYNNWAGPVYFNVIRPFHHVVVGSMAHAGVQGV